MSSRPARRRQWPCRNVSDKDSGSPIAGRDPSCGSLPGGDARRVTFPLAILGVPNLQHTCCRWQMNLQPKPGSRGPHHRSRIASNLQPRCCKFEVPIFLKGLKGKLTALKAGRCFPLLLPNCQITDANNVKYSRGGAQIGKEKCVVCLNIPGVPHARNRCHTRRNDSIAAHGPVIHNQQ
jgi:hypothetical protein